MKHSYYLQLAMSVKGGTENAGRRVSILWGTAPMDDLTFALFRAGCRTDMPSSVLQSPLLDEHIV